MTKYPMRLPHVFVTFILLAAVSTTLAQAPADSASLVAEAVAPNGRDNANTMRITIDATSLPRKLLEAIVEIPLDDRSANEERKVALWYPKWVPGSHGPGGPIANVAGLRITDGGTKILGWERTRGELYRVIVTVPPGVRQLKATIRYIANQPTTTSQGHDSFGSSLLGVIGPATVLLYREGIDIDQTRITVVLRLPDRWQASSALPVGDGSSDAGEIRFAPVSLRTYVDSPILCGRHRQIHDLVEPDRKETIPPHRLHVFSEAESVLDPHPEILAKLRRMVTQAALLFDSHPFDQFDILLATTDMLDRNGLEHSRSSFNILPQRALQTPHELTGWDRLLIPHEYVHSWCGKYRRPDAMSTADFHTPHQTNLLWVYEGLTQYLGELLEARSGLMSEDQFRHRLTVELRHAMHQQGREWRSLLDTAACSSLLRDRSASWPRLRRSQDYYMEGMLFWLEADALIRHQSRGTRSLDDFCRHFFRSPPGGIHPSGFDQDEIIAALNQIAPFDWHGLIVRRIEGLVSKYEPAVAHHLGYSIQYTNVKPDIPETTFRSVPGVDAYDSVGMIVSDDGIINDLLLGSPADRAGLGPGMKIIGVNGHSWSANRVLDAIAMSATGTTIELLVVHGDSFTTLHIPYDGGPRYFTLVRDESGPTPRKDLLPEILKPR